MIVAVNVTVAPTVGDEGVKVNVVVVESWVTGTVTGG